MDKTLTRYRSWEEMHTANVRAWLRVPGRVKLQVAMELTQELYAFKYGLHEIPTMDRTLARTIRRYDHDPNDF